MPWFSELHTLIGLPSIDTFSRMFRAYCPLALYYLLRLITCVPAAAVLLTRDAPDEYLDFGPVLVIYAALLGLVVATIYTIILRAFMTESHDGVRRPEAALTVVAVGTVDMLGGLAAILLSGGWGTRSGTSGFRRSCFPV